MADANARTDVAAECAFAHLRQHATVGQANGGGFVLVLLVVEKDRRIEREPLAVVIKFPDEIEIKRAGMFLPADSIRRRFDFHESDVHVLSATGLMTVNSDEVVAGLERSFRGGREFEALVAGSVTAGLHR